MNFIRSFPNHQSKISGVAISNHSIPTRPSSGEDKLLQEKFTEAKKEDFAKDWGECLTKMIARQKINTNKDIVSSGLIWEFGKLENDTFTRDLLSYSISNPNQLAGLLDYLFSQCESQLSLEAPHVRS